MDDERQVVGGILPDQEDADRNFAQTDNAGGPGDRPTIRPDRASMATAAEAGRDVADTARATGSEVPADSSVAGTAGGGYGVGSGTGSSGGSAGGGANASAGPATDFVRGEDEESIPPDAAGE